MISLIISLFASMSHTITNMFQGNLNANKQMVATKHVASSSGKETYIKTNNNPITVIKPGNLAAVNDSHVATKASNIDTKNKEVINDKVNASVPSSANKVNTSGTTYDVAPSDLSQYDDYAKNISDLKRQIELNKLKSEVYKSAIDYEDPGSYEEATMIGVVVDPHGYKSAHIKLADDTTTDLMIGSRLGLYIVSGIDINEVTLLSTKCKKFKKVRKYKSHHHNHSNHNSLGNEIVIHTDTENNKSNAAEVNPLICRPVKIYPLYRDLNNRLPVNNSGSKTIGPGSTGGARGGAQSTTNAMLNAGGAAGSGGTSISSGGMSLTIPPIETGSHGN